MSDEIDYNKTRLNTQRCMLFNVKSHNPQCKHHIYDHICTKWYCSGLNKVQRGQKETATQKYQ